MPPDLAEKAMELARLSDSTVVDLLRDALRAYEKQRIKHALDEMAAYAAMHNPHGYTEEDIPRLIKEVRSETPKYPYARNRP